jgi:hypothetical protein
MIVLLSGRKGLDIVAVTDSIAPIFVQQPYQSFDRLEGLDKIFRSPLATPSMKIGSVKFNIKYAHL